MGRTFTDHKDFELFLLIPLIVMALCSSIDLCTFMYVHRCDGSYDTTYTYQRDGTIQVTIEGMISTQVAYAKQEAGGIKLILPTPKVNSQQHSPPIEAEITFNHPYERAENMIFFTIEDLSLVKRYCPYLLQDTTSLKCPVEFILKHYYYASLHKSLENLKPHVISKLMPRSEDLDFSLKQIGYLPKPEVNNLNLDLEYQLIALKKLMGCSSNAIFLVTGPFGTGKTRLLATAAYNFLKLPSSKSRVLICTCHIQSADAYINDYFGPMVDQGALSKNTLLRLIGKNYMTNHVKQCYFWCVNNSLDHNLQREINQKALVVTTFINTQQLLELRALPFTHILVDEGAQGREPEAVAPLSLADKHTKIVIAGDHLQVLIIHKLVY